MSSNEISSDDSETEVIVFTSQDDDHGHTKTCSPRTESVCALPTTKLDEKEELPVTKIDLSAFHQEEIGCVSENVEKEDTMIEKIAKSVNKDQLLPGSLSLRDTSLKGPGICLFTYRPDHYPENFGYFFIKKGSELWNEYERSHPRIGEIFNLRRNPHDVVCIAVTLEAQKPLREDIVFSYFSFHTHEPLLTL